MRQSSNSTIMFTDSSRIKEVTGNNYEVFKRFNIGKKLRFVRENLEQIYSRREFSRGKAAKAAGISYQGLKNIEEEINQRPYNGTIELLCKVYDLPLKLITDKDYCDSLEGFMIGKPKEKEHFFEGYYRTNLQRHILDPQYGALHSEDTHIDIDTEAYDVIHSEDGSIGFDRNTIEISLKLYQTSTKSSIGDYLIVEETVLAPEDIEHLKAMIQREVAYMQSKFMGSQKSPVDDAVSLLTEQIERLKTAKKDEM